jgi:hypothetical protein
MMDVIKKNLTSIICGIIAVVAVVALFWPVSGMYETLQAEVSKRTGAAASLNGLVKKSRSLPKTQLEVTEEKTLDPQFFPTPKAIAQAKALSDQVKSQSDGLYQTALTLNRHEPLHPDALPMGSAPALFTFCQKYRLAMSIATNAESRKQSYLVKMMKAGFPPTSVEIERKKREVEDEIKSRLVKDPRTQQPLNQRENDAEIAARVPLVAETMRREAAEQCKLYLELTAFEPFQNLNRADYNNPELYEVYLGQLGLWLHEDVVKSIARANEGAENVMDAPIKRLYNIKPPQDLFRLSGALELKDPNPAEPILLNTAASASGRITQPLFDVIRFQLRILIDAEALPFVLQELSRDKFITVLQCTMLAHDGAVDKTQGFYYGDKPLVLLDLLCEDLFFREWTRDLMPGQIKKALGVKDRTETPAAAPAAQ